MPGISVNKIPIPFRKSGINWSSYWATLLSAIGYEHPMLPGLTIDKVAGVWTITSHSQDDLKPAITSTKYIDCVSGNDSANGNTETTPYKTLNKAMSVAGTDNFILLTPGNYWTLINPTRSMRIVSPNGRSFMTYGLTGDARTWVDDGGGMFHTINLNPVTQLIADTTSPDSNGIPPLLTEKASSVEVAGEANSWWFDDPNNILYVHASDGRQPDNTIIINLSDSLGIRTITSDRNIYIEGLTIIGGIEILNTGEFVANLILYDCSVFHRYGDDLILAEFTNEGTGGIWLKNVKCAKSSHDCIKYEGYGCGIEENVEAFDNDDGNGISIYNGSSMHDNGIVLRLNSEYHDTEGPCIHDIKDSLALNINCNAYDSASVDADKKIAFAVGASVGDTAKTYLFECTTSGVDTVGAKNLVTATCHIYGHGGTIHSVDPGTTLESF